MLFGTLHIHVHTADLVKAAGVDTAAEAAGGLLGRKFADHGWPQPWLVEHRLCLLLLQSSNISKRSDSRGSDGGSIAGDSEAWQQLREKEK